MHSQHPPSPEPVAGRQIPHPRAGWGQRVPAEEHGTRFMFKVFSSLILCGPASVLQVDLFVSHGNKKICVIGRFLLPRICIV